MYPRVNELILANYFILPNQNTVYRFAKLRFKNPDYFRDKPGYYQLTGCSITEIKIIDRNQVIESRTLYTFGISKWINRSREDSKQLIHNLGLLKSFYVSLQKYEICDILYVSKFKL
jgi:hypothetical protein